MPLIWSSWSGSQAINHFIGTHTCRCWLRKFRSAKRTLGICLYQALYWAVLGRFDPSSKCKSPVRISHGGPGQMEVHPLPRFQGVLVSIARNVYLLDT